MADTRTAERVRRILSIYLQVAPGQLVDDANLIDDLGADSLDAVELVMAFEEGFGIEIPDEEYESAETVGQIVSLITNLTAA